MTPPQQSNLKIKASSQILRLRLIVIFSTGKSCDICSSAVQRSLSVSSGMQETAGEARCSTKRKTGLRRNCYLG